MGRKCPRTERCSCTCGITSFEPMKYLILELYETFTRPRTPFKWWNWNLERIMDWTKVILLLVTFRMNNRAQAPRMPVERMSWWHMMSDFGWKKAVSLSKHWQPKVYAGSISVLEWLNTYIKMAIMLII